MWPYSVPYQLVRKRLELRGTATTGEVFQQGNRVASHPREYGRRRYVTDICQWALPRTRAA
ncbi:MAG: Mu transposase domain-containing protein [Actinomycetota bacterium]